MLSEDKSFVTPWGYRSGEEKKQKMGAWLGNLGEHNVKVVTSVSVEQPCHLGNLLHQSPERVHGGEKEQRCCCESIRWGESQFLFGFLLLCNALPSNMDYRGKNNYFSFSSGLESIRTISALWFWNFLKKGQQVSGVTIICIVSLYVLF
jgi:hypothetical protein